MAFGSGSVPRVVLEEGKSALLAQGGGQGTMSESYPSWLRYRAGTMSDSCHSPPATGRARCQICVLRGCGTEADSVAFGTVGPRAAVRARWQIRVIHHPGPAGHDVRFVSFVVGLPKQIRSHSVACSSLESRP